MPACSEDEKAQGAAAAWAKGYRASFAPTKIKVLAVAGNKVTFVAKGSLGKVEMTWGETDMWPGCPTEVEPKETHPPQSGLAYLGDAYYRLPPEAQQLTRIKWPESEFLSRHGSPKSPHASERWGYQGVPVTLESLRIRGGVDGSDQETEHELLFKGHGAFTLDLDGVDCEVEILVDGRPKKVLVQVTHLYATGKGRLSPPNPIDLLDPDDGDPYQVIDVAASGPTTLQLSQKASAMFGFGFHPGAKIQATETEKELVTFLAGPSVGQITKGSDGNDTIEAIRKKLGDFGNVYNAASLLDIAAVLGARKTTPTTVQIVGHGAPGALALGYYWVPRYTDDATGPYYLLDSNPYAYGLLSTCIDKSTRVVIAGCEVGSDESGPLVAGGSTLVFSLYRMWGCDVFAADDMVTSNDFENGYFVGSSIGMTASGWTRTHGRRVFAPETKQGAVPPKFASVELVGAPVLGPNATGLKVGKLDAHVQRYSVEIELSERPLAMDEMVMRGTLDGKPASFFIMGSASILEAVTSDGYSRYFQPKGRRVPLGPGQRAEEEPGAAIWAAIRDALRTSLF
jgi:hypothetical protein